MAVTPAATPEIAAVVGWDSKIAELEAALEKAEINIPVGGSTRAARFDK